MFWNHRFEIVLVLTAVVGAWFWHGVERHPNEGSPPTAEADDPTISRAELESMRLELATLRESMQQIDAKTQEPTLEYNPGADQVADVDDERQVEDEPTGSYGERLENDLRRQAPDPVLADSLEAHVQNAFDDEEVEGVQVSADCGETLCRLDLDFEDVGVRDSSLQQIPYLLPWAGEGYLRVDDLEPYRVVVYAAREGESFADLD